MIISDPPLIFPLREMWRSCDPHKCFAKGGFCNNCFPLLLLRRVITEGSVDVLWTSLIVHQRFRIFTQTIS